MVIRPFFVPPPSLPLLQLLLHPLFTHSHSPVYSSFHLLKPSKEVWGSTVSFPQCPAQRRNVSQLQKLEGIKYTHFGELYTTKMNSLLAVDALIPTDGRDSVCAHRCRYESGFSTRLRFSLRTVTKVCRKLSQIIQ